MKGIWRGILCGALLLCSGVCGWCESPQRRLIMRGTPYETAYYIYTGAAPGPTVVVLGGLHGDEPAGYLAARRIANWRITRGTLLVLPDAHRAAIRRNVRAYPGNMNNMFPGKRNGNAMEQLAYEIFEMVRQAHPDLLLTLHEARGFHADSPSAHGQTFCYDFPALTPRMKRVLDRLNHEISEPRRKFSLFVEPYPQCPTYQAWIQLHTPATTIETCRLLPLKTRIDDQIRAVKAFCDDIGLGWTTAPPPSPPR